jgi:heme-degrading monooxygenase HmoA
MTVHLAKVTVLLVALGVAPAAPPARTPTARIARVWNGQVASARADEYERYLYDNGIKALRRTRGNLGAQMFRRTSGDRAFFVVISYWPSEEAIRAWAGDNLTRTRLLPRDPEFLIEPELEVKHYVIAADER